MCSLNNKLNFLKDKKYNNLKIKENEDNDIIIVNAEKDNHYFIIQILNKNDHYYNSVRFKVLKKLNHPNIIQYDNILVGDYIYIFIKDYDKDSTATKITTLSPTTPTPAITETTTTPTTIKKNKTKFSTLYDKILKIKRFNENEMKLIVNQIVMSLYYLHGEMNMVHRNLNSKSILIDNNNFIKLCDFGYSYKFDDNIIKKNKFSKIYLSLETFKDGKIIKKSDIWSLGCIIIEMAGGDLNLRNSYTPTIPNHLSIECRNFIEKCLVSNPIYRSSAKELLNHRFLEQAQINSNNETSIQGYVKNIEPIFKHLPSPLNSTNRMVLGHGFNKELKVNDIPNGIEVLIFNDDFNSPINDGAIPETIKTIVFGNSFNQSLSGNKLSRDIENIFFGDSFNQPNIDWLPNLPNIQILCFGKKFNNLDLHYLPPHLECLIYHGQFNKPIGFKDLPLSLLYLNLSNYNEIIKKNYFPKEILFLKLGNNQTLETIQSFKNLPNSIIDFSFGCENSILKQIKFDMMPPTITNLIINESIVDLDSFKRSTNGIEISNTKYILQQLNSKIQRLKILEENEFYSDVDDDENDQEKEDSSDKEDNG
ncbi:hypothetical protein ACTFIU_007996 [Dictyostelium citrinum]